MIEQKRGKDAAASTILGLQQANTPSGATNFMSGVNPPEQSNPALEAAQHEGEQADALRKVLTLYGADKKSLMAHSRAELEGLVKAISVQQVLNEQKSTEWARAQELTGREKDRTLREDQFKNIVERQKKVDEDTSAFFNELNTAGREMVSPAGDTSAYDEGAVRGAGPRGLQLADLVAAASKYGNAQGPLVNAVGDILRVQAKEPGTDTMPLATKMPGGYYAFTKPGTKNLDVRPDLERNITADGEMTAVPVKDPETGQVVGYQVPNNRGGMNQLAVPRKQVPESFYAAYHGTAALPGLQGLLNQNLENSTATDEELKGKTYLKGTPDEIRAKAKREAAKYQERLGGLIRMYETQGYGTPEMWEEIRQANGLRRTTPAAEPAGAAKVLDVSGAQEYLRKAGGDKDKARKLAAKDGWTF